MMNLGTSFGKVVDQVKKVKGNQKERKDKEQSEDHRRSSDHDIHFCF